MSNEQKEGVTNTMSSSRAIQVLATRANFLERHFPAHPACVRGAQEEIDALRLAVSKLQQEQSSFDVLVSVAKFAAELGDPVPEWPKVMKRVQDKSRSMAAALKRSIVSINPDLNVLTITNASPFYRDTLINSKNSKILKAALSAVYDGIWKVNVYKYAGNDCDFKPSVDEAETSKFINKLSGAVKNEL